MFKTVHHKNVYYVYNDKFISDLANCFNAEYWQHKNAVIGSAQGRGTTWFIQLPSLQVALRHYRRGGLFGKLVSDSYWFSNWKKARSIAEFHLLDMLKKSNVNVPKPIAARVVKKGLFYQADLLSEKIPNAKDLVDILQERALSESEYHVIAKQIKKMHQIQVNHTDLNIHNILLDIQGCAWLIDFDKCYQQDGQKWKEDNLKRLLRSFNKELKKCNIHWCQDDWRLLLNAYHSS